MIIYSPIVSLLQNKMLNTLAQFVALLLFWGNPLKAIRTSHFFSISFSITMLWRGLRSSDRQLTVNLTMLAYLFFIRQKLSPPKSLLRRKQFFCVTVAIQVCFVKQNLSCNYTFFSFLYQGKHPWLHWNHLYSKIMFLMFFS